VRSRRSMILLALSGLLAALVVSFQSFWQTATQTWPEPPANVDAIVVLTGGGARVSAGLDLLAAGKGDRLYISGADIGVTVADLTTQRPGLSDDLKARIVLGRARDTAGNASETAAWAAANEVRSLYLVTAYYHMPRSLTLLKAALGEVEVWPAPVEPTAVRQDDWRSSARGVSLILGEWLKYLVTSAGVRG
jgi:uncharacterized SAM-binding protein YcdF (DUF218 family)